jgi:hypothetical protein
MNIARLFHVVVVGGALLGGASCESGGDDEPQADAPVSAPDTGTPADDASLLDQAVPGDGATPLIDCFCNTMHDTCCVGTDPAPGYQCCWSTTC